MNENYKLSPLGLIPSDWEVKELIDFCIKSKRAIVDGPFGSNLKTEHFKTEGIPVINSSFVTDLVFNASEYVYVDKELFQREIRSKVVPGDIIMAKIGARCGSSAILPSNHPVSILSGNSLKISIDENENSIPFVWYLLINVYQKNQFKDCKSTGAQPAISTPALKRLKFKRPPLLEQRAIANILGLMDCAINANIQLITQKILRKKWLIQNLLTGKKRLKGFHEEWKGIHIRDAANEVSIRNKGDKQLTVLSCTKYDGLVPSLEYFGRKIFADDLSTYKIVPKNHFAYATNHIEEGSIGYQEILDEALISPMYTVFKTDSSINDTFFYKLVKSHKLVYQYQNRMEGSIDRRGGLRWDAFSIIKIRIPSFEEQTAIAQVLQAADKEIQLLKARTDKLKEQKKGMMQLLLTGKKRLKIK